LQEAVRRVKNVASEHGITVQEVALRWLAFHSALGPDDSIILGASTVREMEDKAGIMAKGPLPDIVVHLLAEVGK